MKDTQKGPAVWHVRMERFHPREEKVAGDEQWLIIARRALGTEVKYFLSNAPEDVDHGVMLRAAFCRWRVERLFRESKNEAGLDHFEGRTYRGWQRHLTLTAVSILFLSEQRERMRNDGEPFTLEQIKQALEVQLDPEMPRAEVRRQLEKVQFKIQYHQRRNASARRSHTKTRRRQLEEAGIDLARVQTCPRVL